MQILILHVERGEVKERTIVEGEITEVVKNVVTKALNLWNPEASDLVVMRHRQEIQVKLPITKEQYERYSKFGLRRAGDKAVFEVPVYVVSYENEWVGEDLVDTKVFIIAPLVDEIVSREIENLAKMITTVPSEEESEEE